MKLSLSTTALIFTFYFQTFSKAIIQNGSSNLHKVNPRGIFDDMKEVFSDVKDKVSDAVDSAGSTVEQTNEKVTNAITIGAENVDLEQVAERLKNEFERIECDDKKLGVCLALSGVPTALFCVTSGPTTAGTTCVLGLVKFSFSAAICVEKNCNGVFSNAILGP